MKISRWLLISILAVLSSNPGLRAEYEYEHPNSGGDDDDDSKTSSSTESHDESSSALLLSSTTEDMGSSSMTEEYDDSDDDDDNSTEAPTLEPGLTDTPSPFECDQSVIQQFQDSNILSDILTGCLPIFVDQAGLETCAADNLTNLGQSTDITCWPCLTSFVTALTQLTPWDLETCIGAPTGTACMDLLSGSLAEFELCAGGSLVPIYQPETSGARGLYLPITVAYTSLINQSCYVFLQ